MRFKTEKQRKAVMAKLMARTTITPAQKKKLLSPHSDVNPVQKRELQLFAENDGTLYNQMRVPIEKNLEKKWMKGAYDNDLAVVAFTHMVDAADKKYRKEIAGDPRTKIFSKADRIAVARALEREFRQRMRIKRPKAYTVRLKR